MNQNFPPVVPDSFALLGFAEIDKNDDMGLLDIRECRKQKPYFSNCREISKKIQ